MFILVSVKVGMGLNSIDFSAVDSTPEGLSTEHKDSVERAFNNLKNDHARMAMGGGITATGPGYLLNLDILELDKNNVCAFLETYKKHYLQCRIESPELYMGVSEHVLARMTRSILKQNFNKDSEGFKRTCKELKIKHTYKAIESYLKGGI